MSEKYASGNPARDSLPPAQTEPAVSRTCAINKMLSRHKIITLAEHALLRSHEIINCDPLPQNNPWSALELH